MRCSSAVVLDPRNLQGATPYPMTYSEGQSYGHRTEGVQSIELLEDRWLRVRRWGSGGYASLYPPTAVLMVTGYDPVPDDAT